MDIRPPPDPLQILELAYLALLQALAALESPGALPPAPVPRPPIPTAAQVTADFAALRRLLQQGQEAPTRC